MYLELALLALLVERAAGYPAETYRRIGHPVTWIGRLVGRLDEHWNHDGAAPAARRLAGQRALAVIVGVPALAGVILASVLDAAFGLVAILPATLLASTLIAQKSLDEHVARVAQGLETEGLAGGRRAVSMIVGRDPEALDEAGVSRAAIESLSENFSDGVVAPAFWLAVGGLPGIIAYKAANTADSMIGHRTARHEDFGRAAAIFDDWINLPASRRSALLIVGAAWLVPGASGHSAWAAVRRDARRHRSPNAGWPEAAMAGALGLGLAGPRAYGGVLVDDAVMNAGGRRDATAADIRAALQVERAAHTLLSALLLALCAGVFYAAALIG